MLSESEKKHMNPRKRISRSACFNTILFADDQIDSKPEEQKRPAKISLLVTRDMCHL